MDRKNAPRRSWENQSSNTTGRAKVGCSSTSVNLSRQDITGFDFMEDTPLNDRDKVNGRMNALDGDETSPTRTAVSANRLNQHSGRAKSLFDLLQELSAPPNATPAGCPSLQGPVHGTPQGTSSLVESSSGLDATGRVGDGFRKRKGEWGGGIATNSVRGVQSRRRSMSVGAVRGPPTLPLRPIPACIKPTGIASSADRSRRVTFVGIGLARPAEENLSSTVPTLRAKGPIDLQQVTGVAGIRTPTLPPGRGGSNDLGHTFISTGDGKSSNNNDREPQRRRLGHDMPETSQEGTHRPKRSSVSGRQLQRESVVTAAEGLGRRVEAERRDIRLGQTQKNDEVVCGDSGMPGRVIDVSVPARGDERWDEGERIGIGQSQHRCEQMGRGSVDESQEARLLHANNVNAQWLCQDDDLRHQGGLWMTQEEQDPHEDRDSWKTHADGGNEQGPTPSKYSMTTAPAPPPEPTGRTAQSPREGHWIQKSENHSGVSNPWATHPRVRNGPFITQSDRSMIPTAPPDSRAWATHDPTTRRRDRGAAVDVKPCRQDDVPPEGDLRERQDGSARNGGQMWDCEPVGEDSGRVDTEVGGDCKELARVRGLCRLRGTILALVEWNVMDSTGVAFSEVSFMLATSLKRDWPQQYIAYLEAKLIFETEDCPYPEASGRGDVAAAGSGAEMVVWNADD